MSRVLSASGMKACSKAHLFTRSAFIRPSIRLASSKSQRINDEQQISAKEQEVKDFEGKRDKWEKVLKKYPVLPNESNSDISFYKKFKSFSEKTANISESKASKQLVLKTIQDSYCELWLPFSESPSLLNQYIDSRGSIRIGKILEDLDRLAGAIAYKHTSDANGEIKNLVIVTAAVDRIDIHENMESDCVYKASGIVTYVGFSSIDISLKLEKIVSENQEINCKSSSSSIDLLNNIVNSGTSKQAGADSSEKIALESSAQSNISKQQTKPVLTARFTMVARNRETGKAEQINPLKLETDEERRIFKLSEAIKREKSMLNNKGLEKNPPNFTESRIMHNIWTEANKFKNNDYKSTSLNENFAWLDDTTMNSVHVCFPQERNIHHKVFGGFLMRVGHELAYANACMYTGMRPISKSLDDFSFTKPVNVGSILRLTSQVVYSFESKGESLFSSSSSSSSSVGASESGVGDDVENPISVQNGGVVNDNIIQVAVKVEVLDPIKQTIEVTNTFYFTFESEKKVKRVIPRTYEDMVKYIEGRRRSRIGNFISKAQ
ncbi:Acyl-coenzyme A thioesterase 9, mitochondrial [Smittium culicis]|uniref:Acyl-coenzyme A thioesterase 9, mitochondrial n=1 Tax=Smittium culicis TaxID=133412 RepID=A0A1R1YD09_9FUNG|nr:Acyl-coenzyme A thioesterase 9, mitochondrial [Smittium culicis]